MGYSDSNQAIQLTDPRKDGRVFTVGIYDNVAAHSCPPVSLSRTALST